MHFIWFLIVGGIAGWLAGLIWKGSGFGLIGDIIIGIIGGLVGGWIAGKLGIQESGLILKLVISVAGAWLILFIISLFKKKT
jgi:uncharacterized membrane protein YeaQ/YmgE (transglycosylase-associated protein family)